MAMLSSPSYKSARSASVSSEEEIKTPLLLLPQEDDVEKYALVGSLSKMKLLQIPDYDEYACAANNSISSLKPAACSIPFKWEDAPGKPKPYTHILPNLKPTPSTLQLPPKLLCSSPSSSPSPARRQYSKHTTSSSSNHSSSKPNIARSLWPCCMRISSRRSRCCEDIARSNGNCKLMRENQQSWQVNSPTSTLPSPDTGLSSMSSLNSSDLDTALCISTKRPDVEYCRFTYSNVHDEAPCSQPEALLIPSSSPSLSLSLPYSSSTFSTQLHAIIPPPPPSSSSCPPSNATASSSMSSSSSSNAITSSSLLDSSSQISSLHCYGFPNLGTPWKNQKGEHRSTSLRSIRDKLQRLLKSCQQWRSLRSERRRDEEERETTYLQQSMDLQRPYSVSGQTLLLEERGTEKHIMEPLQHTSPSSTSKLASLCYIVNGSKQRSLNQKKTSKPRRKKRGWVLKKLRRSPRLILAVYDFN